MMGVMNFQVNDLFQEVLASPKGEGVVTSPFLCDGVMNFQVMIQEALASPKREGMVTSPFLCDG